MIPLANAPRPGRFPARVSQAALGRNAHDVFGPSPVEICVRRLILRQCAEVLTARIICWALSRREGRCVRETMTDYDMPADGWIVFDMGGRPVAAGRNGEEAAERAEAVGVMPLRARVAPATVAEMNALAWELPATSLGVAPDRLPWWLEEPGRRNPGPGASRMYQHSARASRA